MEQKEEPKTKEELRIEELLAKSEDMRESGCEKLADIFENWAEVLKIKNQKNV